MCFMPHRDFGGINVAATSPNLASLDKYRGVDKASGSIGVMIDDSQGLVIIISHNESFEF